MHSFEHIGTFIRQLLLTPLFGSWHVKMPSEVHDVTWILTSFGVGTFDDEVSTVPELFPTYRTHWASNAVDVS
jgi:hypothetical protein